MGQKLVPKDFLPAFHSLQRLLVVVVFLVVLVFWLVLVFCLDWSSFPVLAKKTFSDALASVMILLWVETTFYSSAAAAEIAASHFWIFYAVALTVLRIFWKHCAPKGPRSSHVMFSGVLIGTCFWP